jgi:hypothetical protein
MFLLCTMPVVAQEPTPLLGERVRVHTAQGAAVVGRLSRLDGDTVVVTVVRKNEPAEVALARGSILQVDRSLGQSPDFLRGLGAAVTTSLLTLGLHYVYDELLVPDGWESSGPNAALIAGTAVGVGLLTAFVRKKDRWEPVPALPAFTPVVGAYDGRALLGLRVGF